MRLLLLLPIALVACAGGRLEYDECAPEQLGQMGCALGCPGGGVGCSNRKELAVQCKKGPYVWVHVADCSRCAEGDATKNVVSCEGLDASISALGAPCSTGEACSPDGTEALNCVDGEYRVKDFCGSQKKCGASANGAIGCI